MKLEIIIVYMQRYKNGHEANFVPPITGIYLAALTPANYEVKVLHQQIEEIDINTTADVIALSFFSGFASEAYSLARKFKDKGKIVIAGGPHVTYYADEALNHFDAIITGEAENIWEQVLNDAEQGILRKIYSGQTPTLETAPTPRYDLLPDAFFVKKVVQATRGCLFNCAFCTVPTLNPGFRKRPVDAVLRDIQYDKFTYWWQNKVVWFWDDNLTADRRYVKELLFKMIPLKKWWLTQASIDIVNDEELLDLMKASGCIGVFFGIESFDEGSLNDANKKHNKTEKYKNAVAALHSRGISVMAGLISGFDHDTHDSILRMADRLHEVGIDVPFISILTPFKGTALYEKLEAEHRIISQRGLEFYNGYNVTFIPSKMTPEELLIAHRSLWEKAFSFKHSAIRILRGLFKLRSGAILLSLFMNGFYCLKRLRNNSPINMSIRRNDQLKHTGGLNND